MTAEEALTIAIRLLRDESTPGDGFERAAAILQEILEDWDS